MEFNTQLYDPIPTAGWKNATAVQVTHEGYQHIGGLQAMLVWDDNTGQFDVMRATAGVAQSSAVARKSHKTRTTVIAPGAAPGADLVLASEDALNYTRLVGIAVLNTTNATGCQVYVEQCADDVWTDEIRYETKYDFLPVTDREGNTYYVCAFDQVLGMRYVRVVVRPHASVAMTSFHLDTWLTTVVR